MKKIITILFLILFSIPIFASDWKELQTKEIPFGTPVYQSYTDSGKIKYCIYIDGRAINVSETNAKEFMAGRRRLEIVKWYSVQKDAYKYSIRQLKNNNIDLNTLWQRHETLPLSAP